MEHQPVPRDDGLRQALLTELVLAQGFPSSTEQLCTLVRTRSDPDLRSGDVCRILQCLAARGYVRRVQWPGPVVADRPSYWALPSSPWACPAP